MNELISKAIGMVCAIGQAIGNMFKHAGSGDTTAAAGNHTANNTIQDSVSVAGASHADYTAELIGVKKPAGGLDLQKVEVVRIHLIEQYLASIQRILDNMTIDDLTSKNFAKLTDPAETVLQQYYIKQLHEIDKLLGQDGIVCQSQMEILGSLAPVTSRMASISRGNYDNMPKNDQQLKNLLKISGVGDYQETHDPIRGFPNNNFDQMNDAFTKHKITNPNSLKHLFAQACGESDFGNRPLQVGYPVEKTGAGYLHYTNAGSKTYKLFAEEMNDQRIADFNGVSYNIDWNEAKDIEKMSQNYPYFDRGPGLVAKEYPWYSTAFFWSGSANEERRARSGLNQSINEMIEEGCTFDNVLGMMAYNNKDAVDEDNRYSFPNSEEKVITYNLISGLF